MNLKEVCIQYLEELVVRLRKDDAKMIDVSIDKEVRSIFLDDVVMDYKPTGVYTLKIRYMDLAK